MFGLFKLLALPLVCLVCLICGIGFFLTFVSIRLELAGVSNEMIGFITAMFYGGLLLASAYTPYWIARMGLVRIMITLCAANSLLILLHALSMNIIFWLILRVCSGLALGGFFVVIESWFLLLSPSSARSQTLSIYVFAYYVAVSIGQLFLKFCDPLSFSPYLLSSILCGLAIVPILVCASPIVPAVRSSHPFSLWKNMSTSFKGFFGAFIAGMLLAIIYALVPIYGKKIGLSIPKIGTMMSILTCGGLILQWPMGKWADRSGRLMVLIVGCFTAALFSALIAILGDTSWWLLLIFLWMFGGSSFVLYPLSMSFTCEKIPNNQIVSIAGGFNIVYGVGSIAGPLFAPLFMNWWGAAGLFYFFAIICLITGLIESFPQKHKNP